MPEVSVIIPVFNAENYLSACLDSVISQTYKPIQIILVDDGSDDNSYEICRLYAERDSRIRIIRQKNRGAVAARNLGLINSEGQYIAFVDADDWIEEDMLETLYGAALESGADMVVSGSYLDRGDKSSAEPGRSIPAGVYKKETGEIFHHMIYSDDYRKKGVSSGLPNKLFKRELVVSGMENVSADTVFSEDELCVFSCLLQAETVVVIDRPLYHYCRRLGSVTMKEDPGYFHHADLFYGQMRRVFMESQYSEMLVSKLNRYMVEVFARGINYYRGLGCGRVFPLLYPDLGGLAKGKKTRVVLYGASDTGQDYYRSLKTNAFIELVAWTDGRWQECQKSGLPVDDPGCIRELDYDCIMIGVESGGLADLIRAELEKNHGVPQEKIYWEEPVRLAETI